MAVRRSTDWPQGVAGPLSELERIRSELETLFRRFEPVYARSLSESMSKVHLSEDADAFIVRMELAGMEEHEIELSASGKMLTVSASQEITRLDVDATHSRHSAQRDTAQRIVHFPTDVDPAGMEAKCEEGKLTVRLPKARLSAPRKLTIRWDD